MRPPEVAAWITQCQEERRALDYDPRTRFLDESVREYIESLEEEREKLLEVVDAARGYPWPQDHHEIEKALADLDGWRASNKGDGK